MAINKLLNLFIRPAILIALLTCAFQSSATHYRAGEILYEQITERRYRITAISYTDPNSQADPSTIELEMSFGDGSTQKVTRSSRRLLSPKVVQNVYVTIHEYRIDGRYTISYYDQNRVNGIININLGNTEFIAFYVESTILVNQSIGPNQSPILTKPPIDNGCKDFPYYHNPSAYDPDGDSLTFQLTAPKQATGNVVPNYEDPKASNLKFEIGLNNGQLTWNAPMQEGIYNIAILIREFRKGILVGSVVRDMQITIERCLNQPPVIQDIQSGCVVVGDSISRIISASDPNANQRVSLFGYGGSFVVDRKAVFNPNPATGLGLVTTEFKWKPTCNQVRKSPWQVIFEAKDDEVTQPLVNQNSFFVTVIAPKVRNLKTKQVNNGFELTWNPDSCQLAVQYKVYRRIDSSRWNPGPCETGIPSYTGFSLIATISTLNNPNPTFYYDDNKGSGLSPLVNYCYRIVAVFPPRSASGQSIFGDVTENIASIEVCDNIILSKPVITRVSITETSTTNGKIEVAYVKPLQLDTTVYLPPYRLITKRSVVGQNNYTTVATADYSTYSSIPSLQITDSLLNTAQNQYTYKVDLWTTVNGVFRFTDASPDAQSIRTTIYCTDRTNILSWNANVPWVNDTFIVYRKNAANTFDSLTYTTGTSYADTGLVNNTNYCYLVESKGFYRLLSNVFRNNNFSHEICGTPIDTVRPCAPILVVTPPCSIDGEYRNRLSWSPRDLCARDVVKYRIYHKQLKTDPYELLAELPNTTFEYFDNREELKLSITGCYYVAGVDSAGNESFPANETCVENCPFYDIPNVFTPNNDGVNDWLLPFPYKFVSRVSITVWNRWGNEVFRTNDIDIKWNGKDMNKGAECPDGVYYYICDVYETYLDGERKRTLRGTVQIIRK